MTQILTQIQCVVCHAVCGEVADGHGESPQMTPGAVIDLRGRPFCSDGCMDELFLRLGLAEAR